MRQTVQTTEAPQANNVYSQAVVYDKLIFVAGQVHYTASGQIVNDSTKSKLDQIFKNITAILSEANSSLDNVVKVSIFVKDINIMPELNKLYPTYFTAPYPARETVCVKDLPMNSSIEISVIAVKN